MKQLFVFILFCLPLALSAQLDGNSTLSYPELIRSYEKLAKDHPEIELYEMGDSDYGLPIYLCIVNGEQDSLKTFDKARNSTTLLINNAIHPGEPDGVNACLIWIRDWIEGGKIETPVIAIVPAYNVGGMMNRSGTSRANQEGPEEYGFRGNAQNLDLNRDFIKMDSKNMFTFSKLFHALEPDVFVDTHVSNGADYQYTMSYIASVRERMPPSLGNLMHDEMIPSLKNTSAKAGFDLIPYVNLRDEVPERGIEVFNDLPRYAMGYASLMNAISFTTETHMLKPFPERVESTRIFLDATIHWMQDNSESIEKAREAAFEWERNLDYYRFNYELAKDSTTIQFKGYEHTRPVSEVTGLQRLKYHRDRPFEKEVPFFNVYTPKDSIQVPDFFIFGGQCQEIIDRLMANNIQMLRLDRAIKNPSKHFKIVSYSNEKTPYEGHYLHREVRIELVAEGWEPKVNDIVIPLNQKNKRFIMSVMVPNAPDSYFAWNFLDSYVQQKEYFSPYVFEDKAKELLANDAQLKKEFLMKKETDSTFNASSWSQLYFIYQNSPYYEPTHNVLPISLGRR